MLNVVAMAGLALSLLAAPAPTELSAVPSDNIVIDVQTVNGSGCPAGTATASAKSDNTAFTVSYDNFLAQAGGSANATDSRKNCQINLLVRVPQGFTFAIAKAEYQGHAALQAGASGLQLAHYYFTGQSANAESSHSFDGPLSATWRAVDTASALIYAPCGAATNLNINAELRVDAGKSSSDKASVMAMDSTRGSVRTLFNLSWKQCG